MSRCWYRIDRYRQTVECFNLLGASLRMQRFASEMLVSGIVRLIRSFSPQARGR